MLLNSVSISGNKIQVPSILAQLAGTIHDKGGDSEHVPGEVLSPLFQLNLIDVNEVSFGELAFILQKEVAAERSEEACVVLGSMVRGYAVLNQTKGEPQTKISILVSMLQFEQAIIPFCKPDAVHILAAQSGMLIEDILKLFSISGSLAGIVSLRSEMDTALGMMETAWQPEFRKTVLALRELVNSFPVMEQDGKSSQLSSLREALRSTTEINTSLKKISIAGAKRQRGMLEAVLNALEEIIRQEFILVANVQYVSEGLDQEQIARQASNLIGQVEQRLRVLIVSRFQAKHGGEWAHQIASSHPKMYARWVAIYNKEKSAFKNYNDHSPDLLEFAGFDELAEVISSHWKLFQSYFDFGHETRNEMIFYDKMKQITKVRNPLAHNRTIPENELLRARVLCTDILLALDNGSVSGKPSA
ncbi:MAG: hypothetical protein H6635_02500 [Anaerolineales bacterium]|nr:hypothetical protein [Anaerolineales bacterium]MCB9144212.1 hypothetical protein [Anaerolineales bacterium]